MPREAPYRTVGIVPTVAAFVIALIVLTVGAVIWIQWSAASRNTDSLLRDNATLMLDSIESRIDDHLTPVETYVERMARRAVAGSIALAPRIETRDVLWTSVTAAPQIDSTSILRPDLTELVVDPEHQTAELDVRDHGADPRYAALMQRIDRSDGPVWGPALRDSDMDAPAIAVWQGIRRDGALIGAWGATIPIRHLSRLLAELGRELRGTPFIVDGNGMVVAHPKLAQPLPEDRNPAGPGTPDAVDPALIGDLALDRLQGDQGTGTGGGPATPSVHEVTVPGTGTTYICYLRPFTDYGLPWRIGTWFDARHFAAPRDRLVRSVAIGLAALVVAVIASVWASRVLLAPVRGIADAAGRMARLDLRSVTPMPRSRLSELDDLAQSFNRMLRGLQAFDTYVPRKLVRRLIDDPASLESDEREVSVLFTDIVGFTTMAEGQAPQEVAEMLNDHFRVIGTCIEKFGGTIDKFVGDSLMAFWGAPERMDNTAEKASAAALELSEALRFENRRRAADGKPPVRIRVGIHTGRVLVGNIGAPGRVDYSIVGDTVNAAQRIESLAGDLISEDPVTIMISEPVARQLPADMPYVEVGTASLKGRRRPVKVYRLMT